MARLRTLKTNFTAGEVTPRLAGRADLRAYANGAARLRNVFIFPTGGVTRRAGLAHVDAIPMTPGEEGGRLVAFELNTEQVYLLLFRHLAVDVYRDDARIATLAAPWTRAEIADIAWTQTADTLLVVHPGVAPRRLVRTLSGGVETWEIRDWVFVEETIHGREKADGTIVMYGTATERDGEAADVSGSARRQPYHRFADEAVTLTPSARDGAVTLTASAPVFDPLHAGTLFRLGGREIAIDSVTSPTEAAATVRFRLDGTDPAKDWEEPAFSPLRGWPASCTFHQDRLVIGGSRDLPNRLWLSKSADIFNFDTGEGLDDEGIEFAILSDQVNAVRAVFSGRHLQVFTSGAEWMVSGEPLTPGNIALRRQTRVGSPVGRRVPPRDIDGATVFAGRGGGDLREFLFTDVEQAYQANDLALLAPHLVADPVDQDYDGARRLLHVVMADGSLATVTVYRAEQVTAWTRQETAGAFRSVAVVGPDVYVLVERAAGWSVERFDEGLATDAARRLAADPLAIAWGGLDHLDGHEVAIVADGAEHPRRIVSDGVLTLDYAASAVEAGLPFAHEIAPLPPALEGTARAAQGAAVRMVDAVFRLLDTQALVVDVGDGLRPVPFKRFGTAGVLDGPPAPFTGDRRVRALGWRDGAGAPLWRIVQDAPLPMTLLAVATELVVND